MAYKTSSASNFNFDTTVTINGITYDLLNLDSPISFNDEAGHWNIEVSHSEATDIALDGDVDVTSSEPAEADNSLNSAVSVEATGLTAVTETTETSGTVVDDQATVATGVDAEAATTVETTATIAAEELAADDVPPVEVDDTTSEVTTSAAEVDADGVGDTAEADLTVSEDGSHDLGRQLASWLADLDTLVFDTQADTTEADVDALLPQYADAIADVLSELQTCLATHEASADPVAAEAVSDYLAGIQNKIASADDLLI